MLISSGSEIRTKTNIKYSVNQPVPRDGDSVNISNDREEKDGFTDFLKKGFQHIKDYPKPRPNTGSDTAAASSGQAAMGGGITAYLAGGHPINAVGGALGGYVGIEVGKKTESFSKMMAASFATGAVANTALITGLVCLEAALTGAGINISPTSLAVIAGIGGLSGVSGTLQGSCLGEVKDASTVGMILGGITKTMVPGTPFLPLVASLAGAAGGLVEGKTTKILTSAGTGLVLGAASGIIGGPIGAAVNAIAGAVTGVLACVLGNPAMQVQRNIVDDISNVTKKALNKVLDKLGIKTIGIKTATAIGTLTGGLSSLPLAMMLSPILGPAGIAIGVAAGGIMGGVQMYKMGKAKKKFNEYSTTVKDFLPKVMPEEQLATIPPEAVNGISTMFMGKYKNCEDFKKITPEQFAQDLNEFNKKAMEAQQQKIAQLQKEYTPKVKDCFAQMMPEAQVATIPQEALTGLSVLFSQKYSKEDFTKITLEQFKKDLDEFNKRALETQQGIQGQN